MTLRGKLLASAITDEQGDFVISNISTGDYTLIVSAPGFEERIIGVIVIGRDQTVEITLDVGSTHLSVTAEIGREQETPISYPLTKLKRNFS